MSCKKNFASNWFISWKHRLSRKVKPNSLLPTCFSSLPLLHLASKRHKGMPLHHFWQNHICDAKICWNSVTLWVPWAGWDEPLVCLWSLLPCVTCHHPNLHPLRHHLPQAIIIIILRPYIWMLSDNISEGLRIFSPWRLTTLPHTSYSIPIKSTADTLRKGIRILRERYHFLSPLSRALLQALMVPPTIYSAPLHSWTNHDPVARGRSLNCWLRN